MEKENKQISNLKKILLSLVLSAFILIVLSLNFVSAAPVTQLYLGELAGVHNEYMYNFNVYATVWNNDYPAISECQMNWGDGAGWQVVSKGTKNSWYSVSNTYSSIGTKTVSYKCKNSNDAWSAAISHTIEIQDITPPVVTFYVGESALAHNSSTYSKTIYADYYVQESQTSISQCSINWGDGATSVVNSVIKSSWQYISHTYATASLKTISATCQNSVGLLSNVASDTIQINNLFVAPTPPTITITSPANGGTYTNGTSITLNANADQAVAWTYNLDNGANSSFVPGTTAITALTGTHTLNVFGTNLNGTGSSSATYTVINPIVLVAPIISITSPINGQSYLNSSLIQLNASVTNGQTVSWLYNLDNTGNNSFVPGNIVSALSTVGNHTLVVYGTNISSGLVGSASVNYNVTALSETPPINTIATITITSPANGGTYTNGTSITLNANADQAVAWTYNIDNSANLTFTPGVTQITALTGTPTLRVFGINANGTGSSSVIYTVTNPIVVTNGLNINITGVNPSLSTYNGTALPVSINFTSDDYNLSVIFNLYNNLGIVINSSSILMANNSFLPLVYTIPASLANGTYSLYLNATNSLGNSSNVLIGSFSYTNLSNSTSNPVSSPVVDDDEEASDDDSKETNVVKKLTTTAQTSNTGGTINLGGNKKEASQWFSLENFLWLLGIFIFLILVVIIMVLAVRRGR